MVIILALSLLASAAVYVREAEARTEIVTVDSAPLDVTFEYSVTNNLQRPITSVSVKHAKCSSVVEVQVNGVNIGDNNANHIFDSKEVWNYECSTVLAETTPVLAIVNYTECLKPDCSVLGNVATCSVTDPLTNPCFFIRCTVPGLINPCLDDERTHKQPFVESYGNDISQPFGIVSNFPVAQEFIPQQNLGLSAIDLTLRSSIANMVTASSGSQFASILVNILTAGTPDDPLSGLIVGSSLKEIDLSTLNGEQSVHFSFSFGSAFVKGGEKYVIEVITDDPTIQWHLGNNGTDYSGADSIVSGQKHEGDFLFAFHGFPLKAPITPSKFSVGGVVKPVKPNVISPIVSSGGGGDVFTRRGFAFNDPDSPNYDGQAPKIQEVLVQEGSLKILAEINDSVGVKDVSLVIGKNGLPMKRHEGSQGWWVRTLSSDDLSGFGNTLSFKIVARDYNSNKAEYSGSVDIPLGALSSTAEGASFSIRSLTADEPNAAYSITGGVYQNDENVHPQITIKNTGTESLKNVRLMLSPELKGKFLLSDYAIKHVAPESEFTVSLRLNGKPNVDEMGRPIPYSGQVMISVDNHTPYIVELSGKVPNQSISLQSLFLKNLVSKSEQRYKSFANPDMRISDTGYNVKLGSGGSVVKSASEELIISNTGDKPLRNLRIMTSSLSDHFLLEQKNVGLLPAGSFVKVKLVSKLTDAQIPKNLQGEIIIAPENGIPVTVAVEIERTLVDNNDSMYEVGTTSGNEISSTVDSIIIRNNSGEVIDGVRIILPQKLTKVFSLSNDSFKSIEPNSQVEVHLRSRGTTDSHMKQILNDYTGEMIVASVDGMKKIIPVNMVWKGITSEHFLINVRDTNEELTKASHVINFVERNYDKVTGIIGDANTDTRTIIYMIPSHDELKHLSNMAPSVYFYKEDVAFVWSNSEDVNILALKEFVYRTIMNNYGTYWSKQKISIEKGNWFLDGLSHYATASVIGERGVIESNLEMFIKEPVRFEWYGEFSPSHQGASYVMFKFLADKYGHTMMEKILKNLGSTMVNNDNCHTGEECALLRAVYDANKLNMDDKKHDMSFSTMVQEWKDYIQEHYGIDKKLG